MANKDLAMWTSDRSQVSCTYSDVTGAISKVNYNVAAGYTAVPTLHQLNPPKPDILVPPIVGPVVNGSANVPNGYNLVFINAKTGWAWPGDVIDYTVAEGPSALYDPATRTFRAQ
jgi:hypothetical protein